MMLSASEPDNNDPRRLTTKELALRARHRYEGQGFAVFREVRFDRQEGHGRTRRADLVAVGLERQTGHEIHGIEIKVTRADWLQELREKSKADDVRRYCHAWWLLVPHASIVRPSELPEGWGLLVPRGRYLVALVPAPVTTPLVDHRFMASLVQSAATQHGYCASWARVSGYTKGMEAGRRQAEAWCQRWHARGVA